MSLALIGAMAGMGFGRALHYSGAMPRLWPDPRDPEPPPSKAREFLFWFALAVIGAFFIANIGRGLMGMGWNW